MIPLQLNYDGRITLASAPLVGAGSRGLRYGDGLFETMRFVNGAIPLFNDHTARLFAGMQEMGFTIPESFTAQYLQNSILELCRLNNHLATTRIRLMVFRGNGTLYELEDNHPHYIIETAPLTEPNTAGLLTGIYTGAKKSIDNFSHIKSNSFQPYMLTAQYARKMGWHDGILLNTSDHICESTIANIFLIKDGIIITPALSQGCIAGVMRKQLLHTLPALGYQVVEGIVTTQMLSEANEVFFTNAVQGIRWVAQIDNRLYQHAITTQIKHSIGY